ncbi:MAG: hypothetical protein WCX08_00100 [Candidatus Buchananbacteria bacterium]
MIEIGRKKSFFVFVILFFLAPVLFGCVKNKPIQPIDNETAQPPVLTEPELESKYESELIDILKPVWQNESYAGVKSRILALRVPAKYLDLHFNLVVAFELIEQGQGSADQAKIDKGLAKLDELKVKYGWLKAN